MEEKRKRVRGNGKMWAQVIDFSSNLVHSLFPQAIQIEKNA